MLTCNMAIKWAVVVVLIGLVSESVHIFYNSTNAPHRGEQVVIQVLGPKGENTGVAACSK